MKWIARLLAQKTALRWAAEVAGVVALSVAAATWQLGAGIAIIGAYLVIVGNTGGDDAGSS